MKFLHMLEIDQALLAHTPGGAGIPKKNLVVKIKKSGLKFSVLDSITSELVRVSSRDFFKSTPARQG